MPGFPPIPGLFPYACGGYQIPRASCSGKIWTDHNVHDPGITILEVLCYAMLDLGYRTHLAVEDVLAKNPTLTNPEDNFFTPRTNSHQQSADH